MNIKPSFFDRRDDGVRIHYEKKNADYLIGKEIFNLIPVDSNRPIIIICIGTDRSTGDSLGPLIGTFLEEKMTRCFFIYGTLEDPIHAINLEEKIVEINNIHHHPFIIGIDACLGRLKSIGIVQIGKGPVKPGAGVNKELPAVGDIHLTGIVNVSGFMDFFVLQNTRLNLVLKMAKTIANGIYQASLTYYQKQTLAEINWNRKASQEHTP
ncbi:spore protease YyaC [Bacillus aquiflavi]|uniref:spore protease YyaC n=1 Tax=Bacillus aquiflavi TaxID=2672567 RepID=UPI001CA8A89E|nr:spore protease YyaC [Bacillus aquiflavi]UAC48181.1 spore protease YyaC [Bacillus aquiflavi]